MGDDAAVDVDRVRLIPAPVVLQDDHQAEAPAAQPLTGRRAVVETEIRVAVENEESICEKVAGAANGTERSVQSRGIEAVLDRQPKPARPDALLDALAEVTDAEDHSPRAVIGEQPELMEQ